MSGKPSPVLTTSTIRLLCSLLLAALFGACGGPVSRVDWDDKGTQEEAAEVPQVLVVSLTGKLGTCLLYTSPSPRDKRQSRMPSSA